MIVNSRKIWAIFIISVFMVAMMNPCAILEASDAVVFPDQNLEKSVREALGKPEGVITAADMSKLEVFLAWEKNISNLTGLEYATNLKKLDLFANTIADIGPLSDLSALEYLHLGDNHLIDINALSGLTNLKELYLPLNQIQDINPLNSLINLERLDLSDNRVGNINPLSSLASLTRLNLSNNEIADVLPLSGIGGLERLFLSGNNLTGIAPLAGLINIRRLDLSANDIATVDVLAQLANIEQLNLSANNIETIDALAQLANLEQLNLSANNIADISFFATSALNRLKSLDLSANQIGDLQPLAGLTGIMQLMLADNQIVNLTPLGNLTQLWELDLSANGITGIAPLAELAQLQWLGLSANQISNISSLKDLNQLGRINLSNNQISNIGYLSGLSNLYELELAGNQIKSIVPLGDLKKMSRLRLSGNQIRDISPLNGMTSLQLLDLSGNLVHDLAPLADNHGLIALNLSGNQIGDISALSGMSVIRMLYLADNYLDIREGSGVMAAINALQEKEVRVFYLPQKPMGNIKGLVVDDDSGNPLENVLVTATDSIGNLFRANTNKDGRYDLRVPVGINNIEFRHFGYQTARINNVLVNVHADTTVDVRLLKWVYGEIKGKVTGDGGTPLGNVQVTATNREGFTFTVKTDTAGAYRLTVPVGLYNLEFSRIGYEKRELNNIAVGQGVATDAGTVQMTRVYGSLRGKVTDAANKALPGVEVTVMLPEGDLDDITVLTDSKGEYRLDNIPVGSYDLIFRKYGYQSIPIFAVRLIEDKVIIVDTVKMNPWVWRNITGKVLDLHNKPLEGVAITARSDDNYEFVLENLTDSEGTYVWQLPTGNYTLEFRRAGFVSRELKNIRVRRGETPMVITPVRLTPAAVEPPPPPPPPPPPHGFSYGDINGDGKITVLDAILCLRHIVQLTDLTDTNIHREGAFDRARVNGKETLTVLDAILILRRIVNLIEKFPVELLP